MDASIGDLNLVIIFYQFSYLPRLLTWKGVAIFTLLIYSSPISPLSQLIPPSILPWQPFSHRNINYSLFKKWTISKFYI